MEPGLWPSNSEPFQRRSHKRCWQYRAHNVSALSKERGRSLPPPPRGGMFHLRGAEIVRNTPPPPPSVGPPKRCYKTAKNIYSTPIPLSLFPELVYRSLAILGSTQRLWKKLFKMYFWERFTLFLVSRPQFSPIPTKPNPTPAPRLPSFWFFWFSKPRFTMVFPSGVVFNKKKVCKISARFKSESRKRGEGRGEEFRFASLTCCCSYMSA